MTVSRPLYESVHSDCGGSAQQWKGKGKFTTVTISLYGATDKFINVKLI